MSPTTLSDSVGTLPKLLTKREAAAYLQVSQEGLDNLRRAGMIPAIKVGALCRFDVSDLADYLQRQREASFVRTPRPRTPAKSGKRGRSNKRSSQRAA